MWARFLVFDNSELLTPGVECPSFEGRGILDRDACSAATSFHFKDACEAVSADAYPVASLECRGGGGIPIGHAGYCSEGFWCKRALCRLWHVLTSPAVRVLAYAARPTWCHRDIEIKMIGESCAKAGALGVGQVASELAKWPLR